jgi:hypothetical protein
MSGRLDVALRCCGYGIWRRWGIFSRGFFRLAKIMPAFVAKLKACGRFIAAVRADYLYF